MLPATAAETPLTAEEAARIAVGLRGGFTSLEGTNILLSVYGGSYIGTNVPLARRSRSVGAHRFVLAGQRRGLALGAGRVPAELVFKAALNSSMGKLILRVSPNSPPESWPRDFELLISVTGPDSGYQSVLKATFPREEAERLLRDATRRREDPVPAPLRFTFPETRGIWVMLRILSNHGHPGFTSLAEVEGLSGRGTALSAGQLTPSFRASSTMYS